MSLIVRIFQKENEDLISSKINKLLEEENYELLNPSTFL